jgi:hypothetical protein
MNDLPVIDSRPRHIDTRDVAKLIRKQLKKNFAGTKFSVRIDRYAGGSSVDVNWTDGPTQDAVKQVVAGFKGGRFDGMIDLMYGASSWYCDDHGARTAATHGHSFAEENGPVASRCCAKAELVDMGASFVFAQRSFSPELKAEINALIEADEPGLQPYDQEYTWNWNRIANEITR